MQPPGVEPACCVVVVGDVMTDVVVRPLTQLAPASDTPSAITITPGGSASNQAVWLARSGTEVHFVGAVGDDEPGRAAERSLDGAGVRTHLRRVRSRPTGTVVCLVGPDGQRSMLTERGANLALDPGALPDALFRRGAHLHLSGYGLLDEESRPAALAALALAGSRGMTRSVDPCSTGPLARVGGQAFLAWTGGVDLLCGNLDEGVVLAGAGEPDEVAARLCRHYGEVALTLGAGGALWAKEGTPTVRLPAASAAVVDTTGAGDAFTGTFLARRLAGAEPGDALRSGLDAAARVVAVPGARPWG